MRARGDESGELRAGDADLAAFFFWSRVHGIVMLLLACDFSGETLASKADFTPEVAFELTRALAFEGVAPAGRAEEEREVTQSRAAARPRDAGRCGERITPRASRRLCVRECGQSAEAAPPGAASSER
jgi:hypothetical protein